MSLSFSTTSHLKLNLFKLNHISLQLQPSTAKPVLTTTSEQQPPVYNDQLEPLFSKSESNFIGINCE
jgi:hypothetical protein